MKTELLVQMCKSNYANQQECWSSSLIQADRFQRAGKQYTATSLINKAKFSLV